MNGKCLDAADCRLLGIVQDGIPITVRPYEALGKQLGMTGEEILARLEDLRAAGIVLGITPVLEPRRVGIHAATLVALRVPEDRIDEVARIVTSYPEVSHNYRRDHEYALWFTLSAPTPDRLNALLDDIRQRTGITENDLLDLPTVQKLKIGLRFSFVPAGAEVQDHG